jgi:hypothetical protein
MAAAPETVAVTYRFSPASEAALHATIDEHWATLVRLNLVTGEHAIYRGSNSFLEIFTWRDDSIPDNAPAEVRAIWRRMNTLVDSSGGKSGLEISAVERVDGKDH